jgi:dipeptidase
VDLKLWWGFETTAELARAKVSKFVGEKFAETTVNQQPLSKVYSCCGGGSKSLQLL